MPNYAERSRDAHLKMSRTVKRCFVNYLVNSIEQWLSKLSNTFKRRTLEPFKMFESKHCCEPLTLAAGAKESHY